MNKIVPQLTALTERAYSHSVNNGFHEKETSIPEKLMFIVSELSEALEASIIDIEVEIVPYIELIEGLEAKSYSSYDTYRHAYKDTFSDEIADTFIRLFTLCGDLKIDIDTAIRAKMAYNEMRPYKHGKKF